MKATWVILFLTAMLIAGCDKEEDKNGSTMSIASSRIHWTVSTSDGRNWSGDGNDVINVNSVCVSVDIEWIDTSYGNAHFNYSFNGGNSGSYDFGTNLQSTFTRNVIRRFESDQPFCP
jgi:hypothetical protein